MSILDLLILAATLILAALAPRLSGRSWLAAAVVLAALFALQLAFEGYYWQWLPAYALAIAAFGFAMRKQPIRRKWLRWTGRAARRGIF